MRRLNLLRKELPDKDKWRKTQQKQIDDFNRTDFTLQAAFPGSFVFNHILVPSVDWNLRHTDLSLPEVSDIVYANCSDVSRDQSFDSTVVIDADDVSDLSVVDAIVSLIDELTVSRVVVLGQSSYKVFGDALKAKINSEAEVVMIEPDWNYALVLHNIYRQAEITIFVNSMRVLDAAYTGCDCVLFTDKMFCENPVFRVLHEQLARVGCEMLDECGQIKSISADLENNSSLIVDNSIAVLERELHQSCVVSGCDTKNEDWLSSYKSVATDPVINPSFLPPANGLSGLRDRKTGISRKIIKLRDDPQAFFADSNSAALRFVADTLWAKSEKG